MKIMKEVTLTICGYVSIADFFDELFGAGNYCSDAVCSDVLEFLENRVAKGEDTNFEATLPSGKIKRLPLFEGGDFTVETVAA